MRRPGDEHRRESVRNLDLSGSARDKGFANVRAQQAHVLVVIGNKSLGAETSEQSVAHAAARFLDADEAGARQQDGNHRHFGGVAKSLFPEILGGPFAGLAARIGGRRILLRVAAFLQLRPMAGDGGKGILPEARFNGQIRQPGLDGVGLGEAQRIEHLVSQIRARHEQRRNAYCGYWKRESAIARHPCPPAVSAELTPRKLNYAIQTPAARRHTTARVADSKCEKTHVGRNWSQRPSPGIRAVGA